MIFHLTLLKCFNQRVFRAVTNTKQIVNREKEFHLRTNNCLKMYYGLKKNFIVEGKILEKHIGCKRMSEHITHQKCG